MEGLIAVVLAVLVGSGVYLLLRSRLFPVILGLTLLSYAANLFVFSMGRLTVDGAPVGEAVKHAAKTGEVAGLADPLPQALVLTAIVIGFGMTAFVVALTIKAVAERGTDHVDGETEAP
ncbi:MAG: Na+/H+ antiporter subunit C [Bradymonadaceae bacterium]